MFQTTNQIYLDGDVWKDWDAVKMSIVVTLVRVSSWSVPTIFQGTRDLGNWSGDSGINVLNKHVWSNQIQINPTVWIHAGIYTYLQIDTARLWRMMNTKSPQPLGLLWLLKVEPHDQGFGHTTFLVSCKPLLVSLKGFDTHFVPGIHIEQPFVVLLEEGIGDRWLKVSGQSGTLCSLIIES